MRLEVRSLAWVGIFMLFIAQAHADDSSNCSDSKQPWTYHAQSGDVSSSTRLDVQRPSPELHSLQVNVCSGELRVKASPRGSEIRLEVTSPGAGKPLGAFLQTFSTVNGEATLTLQVPKDAHATATLFLPLEKEDAENEINLGAGTLRLEGQALRGDRKLNVGAGEAYVELNGDHDYSGLQTNIGMGYLSDTRPGGHNGFFVVSRSSTGMGKGAFEINVGAGSIHLMPAAKSEDPI